MTQCLDGLHSKEPIFMNASALVDFAIKSIFFSLSLKHTLQVYL